MLLSPSPKVIFNHKCIQWLKCLYVDLRCSFPTFQRHTCPCSPSTLSECHSPDLMWPTSSYMKVNMLFNAVSFACSFFHLWSTCPRLNTGTKIWEVDQSFKSFSWLERHAGKSRDRMCLLQANIMICLRGLEWNWAKGIASNEATMRSFHGQPHRGMTFVS